MLKLKENINIDDEERESQTRNKNYLKTEILELKTITETKVLLHGLKSRLETAGERTSEAEDNSVTMT